MRKITKDDVEILIIRHPEHESIEGSSNIPEVVEAIRSLAEETEWGWCGIEVCVRWDEKISGSAYLGCCSYASEENFKKGGHYEGMLEEALDDLNRNVEALEKKLEVLR